MLSRFGDLLLESEIALPALPAAEGSAACFVRVGPAGPNPLRWDHHWRAPDGTAVLSCARDGHAYRLGVPRLASFAIDASGGEITCRSEPDVPPETLEHLLLDQVMPRVLAHRGRLVLHAGCVSTPEGAVAFLGDSGAGKSTLCAAFARAGDPVVGDDGIVARGARGGGFEAFATYPGLRLFADPLARLFGESERAPVVAHTTSKRRVLPAEPGVAFATGAVPLLALYTLESGKDIRITPIEGTDAFTALVRASYQLHLGDEHRSRGLFEQIGGLIEAVPMRRLSYPRDLSRLPAVREAVVADSTVATRPRFIPASSEGCACS